jgi:photosystem I protein
MTAQAKRPAAKPNYTFRASWALLLLAINIFVGALYSGFIKI